MTDLGDLVLGSLRAAALERASGCCEYCKTATPDRKQLYCLRINRVPGVAGVMAVCRECGRRLYRSLRVQRGKQTGATQPTAQELLLDPDWMTPNGMPRRKGRRS